MPRKTVVATHCHFTTFPAKYIKNTSLSAVLAGDLPIVAFKKMADSDVKTFVAKKPESPQAGQKGHDEQPGSSTGAAFDF